MMSAIGDAVHVLPVVTALKRHDPVAHITWMLQPGPASLVRGHPDVDEIIVFDEGRAAGARMLDLRAQLAAEPFDLVIDLQVYIKAGLVTALTRAPVKLGFDRARARDMNWLFTTHRIPPHAPQHVQDQYFEFLAALGIPAEPVRWNLGPWPAERAARARSRPVPAARSLTLVIGARTRKRSGSPSGGPQVATRCATISACSRCWPAARSARELATERASSSGAAPPDHHARRSAARAGLDHSTARSS